MPRKTPVRELQGEEENQPTSPLRRSSRLASPGPSKLLQRRNSTSEDSPAKLPKAKRLSLSMRRESEDLIPKTEEKLKENVLDTPKRGTRATRSSSKSPLSLPSETESKPPSIRTRSRTGSISKIVEEKIMSETEEEEEENMNPKSSQNEKSKATKETTPSKVKTRRPSIKDKMASLEVIEESPKPEPQSKAALTKKESLISIAEGGDDSKETSDISTPVKKISNEIEKKITVEENGDEIAEEVETESPDQSSNSKVALQNVTTNGTKESPPNERALQKKTETDSCKISPVVILNSIEKQMHHSKEKISLNKVEMSLVKDEVSSIKDETKSVRNKSPVVVLQSIEKIISKKNFDKNVDSVEPDKKIEADVSKNEDVTSEKEILKDEEKDNGIDESLNQKVLPDEKCKSDESKSVNITSKQEEGTGNKEDKISEKEKLENSINENQSLDQKALSDELCKVKESETPSVKLQKINLDEVKTSTINDNQSSEVLTSSKESVKETLDSINDYQRAEVLTTQGNIKESLSSLLVNQKSVIEGSDGSFSMSLSDLQNNTQEDITNQSKIIDSTENQSEGVNNISNSSENSDKENSDKPPQINETEISGANVPDSEIIEPKENLAVTNENVLASNVMKNVNEKTEQSSFYEPMEIEYTDFNCTVNSSVMESKNEEDSLICETGVVNEKDANSLHEKEEVNADAINKENELEIEDTSVTNPKVDSNVTKEINEQVTENVKEVLNESNIKSNLVENKEQDVTKESEICDEPVEESMNKTLELEQNVSEQAKEMISTDAQKSVSFAFNLEDEQYLSDEDVINGSQEEKNDNDNSSLNSSKLESDVINSKDASHNVQNDSHVNNQEITTAKSPSPVFSVDENQCLSDTETDKIDNKDKELDGDGGINKEEKSSTENNKTQKSRSPSPTFSVDDSQSGDKFNSPEKENENETVTKELDQTDASKDPQTTSKKVESETEKADCNSENPALNDESEASTSINFTTDVNEQQSSSDQPENIEVKKAADDKKLIDNKDVGKWKSKSKKFSKKSRRSTSNIEDNLTSTVRALIENVDDLDAKVDALIEKEKESSNLNQDGSDDEISENSFIDDMAEEGEEDTPSEGSNDIPIEGESLDSLDTTSGSDDSYEQDSFINDDEINSLLSGDEDFLEERKPRMKQEQANKNKKRRIILESEESNEAESQVKLSEDKESLQVKSASCDSDDKMSTDPYLGLTPPSHVSVEESSSDIDLRSLNNENEIIINDDDNLKSLEALKDVTNPISKQVDVAKASSIICLDSDEDGVFQKKSESPSELNDTSKDDKTENEEEATNIASTDLTLLTKSPKSRSSLNIQECIKLADVEAGTLTNKICGIVDFFYSNIKQNNSTSGTVSLNVSLDFDDAPKDEDETPTENLKVESSKKRMNDSVESLSEKKRPKRMRRASSPKISVSNENGAVAPDTMKTPAPAKKIKRKKRDVSEFDVESVDISDVSPSVKSKTFREKKLIEDSTEKSSKEEVTDDLNADDSPAIKAKHFVAKENLTDERKRKNKIEERESQKVVKDSYLVGADKENEEVIPQKTTEGKKLKRKKAREQAVNKEILDDETVNETKGTFIETSEHDIPQMQDKKRKKKSKRLLKISNEDSAVNVVESLENNDTESNENHDKIPKKKKSKVAKSNQQEIKADIASASENVALDEKESNDKIHKKKKPKLPKPDIIETQEADLNKDTKQKKKKKSKTVENKEIVEDEAQTIKQTESTSNEKSKKSKRKRKYEENDEYNELETAVSSEVPSKSEDETLKKPRKRTGKGSFLENVETEKSISYFPSHMLKELSTKTTASNEEVPKIKKVDEKRLKKKKNFPTFSVSSTSDSNPWITTQLEKAIIPSKQNTVHSNAGASKSAKKRKLQEENQTFASKDFKNKMLYDTSRVKRMSSQDLLKSKMKLLTR